MKTKALLVAGVLWSGCVLYGMHALLSYNGTAGSVGQLGDQWQAKTRLSFESGRPNLVIFAHPRCPCSRATLAELEHILVNAHTPVSVQVIFYRPSSEPDAWAQTALFRRASGLPGVRVLTDPDGEEAMRFGAETSGHAIVLSKEGKVLFSGGITGSRGHEGENAGAENVLHALHGEAVSGGTPVFGCQLVNNSPR